MTISAPVETRADERPLSVTVVVGNPKPRSRTWDAAHRVARAVAGPEGVIHALDVVDLGPGLLSWGDPRVGQEVARLAAADLAVVASPTFKGTYSGLLKLFLDQVETGTGLQGVVAVPLQLGAGPAHALAPELHLRPLLAELGATTPAPGLYLLDSAPSPDAAETAWLGRWAGVVRAAAVHS